MSPVLTSWKEIAAHFDKGVRTVQRWEKDLGVPIRRPDSGNRIVAETDELDQWLRNRFQLHPKPDHIADQQILHTLAIAEDIRRTTRVVVAESRKLKNRLRDERHGLLAQVEERTQIAKDARPELR